MYKFNTYESAKGFTDKAIKIWMIVLGDDGLFWAVTPMVATKLESEGYEII